MNRRELLRILEASGCVLRREGARHSIFLNPATGKTAAVPRHTEIKQALADKIRRDLGLPER